MSSASPAPSPRSRSVDIGSVRMGLLGHVGSPRGVRIIAIDGMPNDRGDCQVTTTLRFLSYLPRIPADGTISLNRRPARLAGPLNFLAPGVSMAMHGSGPVRGALCIFDQSFLTDLAETESRLRFDEIDFMASIDSARMTYLGQAMLREALQPGFASSLGAEAIGLQIALEITRYDGATPSSEPHRSGGLAAWQMKRLASYIHEHLSDDLTLHALANLLGISVRHLSRAIRQAEGVSAHRWIANFRFAEARRLLAQTDLPVSEIAQRSAFQSAAAFATAFRAASGFSPSEFRRRSL
jgi:AraC-like DNA-binding protein